MEELDRISKLSNPLLHHILSFIDMKCVVQTCILSKRWRYVWIDVSTLNFSSEKFYDLSTREKVPTFINFVDKVLEVNSDIEKFSLYWGNVESETVTEHLSRWILAVLRHPLQELSVHTDVSDELKLLLPQFLFNSPSLVQLVLNFTSKLSSCAATLPSSMGLPKLKSLTLGSFCTDDVNLVDKILSSCPLLESLVLRDLWIEASDHVTVNIESSELKHLEIINNYTVTCPSYIMDKIIKLSTPNLTSFVCKDFMLQEYSVENLSSLISADIEMIIENETDVVQEELQRYLVIKKERKELYPKRMLNFLEGLHNVKELTLSHGSLQVLSAAPDLFARQIPAFSNLRSLTLETKCCSRTIGYLLKISTNLESLVLTSMERSLLNDEDDWRESLPFPEILFSDELKFESTEVQEHDNEFSSAHDEDDWEGRLPLPHMLSQLKFVEIKEVQGCDNEFKFLAFLFRTAMVLEELILFFCPSKHSCRKHDRIAKFSENLKRLPRASSSVTMIFLYS